MEEKRGQKQICLKGTDISSHLKDEGNSGYDCFIFYSFFVRFCCCYPALKVFWKIWHCGDWINSEKIPCSGGHSQVHEKLVHFPWLLLLPPYQLSTSLCKVDSFSPAFLETCRSFFLVKGSYMIKDWMCDHLVLCFRQWDAIVLKLKPTWETCFRLLQLFLTLTSYNHPLGLG